jgi:hypothetical protein
MRQYETRQVYIEIWWRDLMERDHLEDLGVDGRVILTFIIQAHAAIEVLKLLMYRE